MITGAKKLVTGTIIREILKGYQLPIDGDHGVVHWARVLENGLRLAQRTGADCEVVVLFALFHDSRRENEFEDEGHGLRGAELARTYRGRLYQLSDENFELLYESCRLHTAGLRDGHATLQTCWDADRLDLGRVGITPLSHKLCTEPAREMLAWAHDRAISRFHPEIMKDWQLPLKCERHARPNEEHSLKLPQGIPRTDL